MKTKDKLMPYPLITVSIPVYNCGKYIERSINSVLNQTYPNIEILLVDDKGKDDSSEIIRKIQSQYSEKIRIIEHENNQGLSIVRNTGIDHAKGKYLFFLDGDDEITSNCIEGFFNLMRKEKVTLVVGKMIAKNTFLNSEYEIFPSPYNLPKPIRNNIAILDYFCKGAWPVSACNKLFKVDFFRQNKIYFIKGLFSQDELWSFHTALKLDSIAFLDEYTYWYYLHSESSIFNKTKQNFEDHQTIVEYITKAYKKESKIRKKSILNYIINFKETTLLMQWQSLRNDINYWKQNYSKLKKAPSLSISDYFSLYFSKNLKKKNLFQNLPTELGYRLFRWRFERK